MSRKQPKSSTLAREATVTDPTLIDYRNSYEAALATLEREFNYHESQSENVLLDRDLRLAEFGLMLQLRDKIAEIKSEALSHSSVFTAVNPPSKKVAEKALKLATDLANTLVSEGSALGIVKLVNDFLTNWAGLK